MLQELIVPESEQLTSVPRIATEYARGLPYTHHIEPELRATVPRRARRPSTRWGVSHRWVLNLAVGCVAVCVYLLRLGHASTGEWIHVAVAILTGFVFFASLMIVGAMLESRDDLFFLRHGTATTGVFTSGPVNDCEETTYRLTYNFYVGGRLHSNEVAVSKSEYARYTSGNPYFTVLYHGQRLVDSVPYFQITKARL
ncbi:MAG: hypothetical protein H8F28_03250 [Fibrella sp.]|nr:hypothetical protein [Armatimonadota bacterium]